MEYEIIENQGIGAFYDIGDKLVLLASYTEAIVVEKSALIPAGCSNPRWQEAVITPCGCVDVPAEPNTINFGWQTALMLTDPDYAAWRVKRDYERRPAFGNMLRRLRESWKMSVGQAAEMSGIPGQTIAAMEAGLPVYPSTTFWKVVHAFAKHKCALMKRRQARS